MRASREGRHVSGAERLVEEADVDEAVGTLTRRARDRAAPPDFVQVTVERLPRDQVAEARVLRLILTPPSTAALAQNAASIRLSSASVSQVAIEAAFELLTNGAVHGGSARGAMLIDASTGANVTPDVERGVRASRFDYHPDHVADIDHALADAGLSHFRTREALALSTKVIWSGVRAELCWSDDAGYTAGYVATVDGYVRFADFKPAGAVGGRAFFIDTQAVELETVVKKLQRDALWIRGPLRIDRE